MRNFLFGLLAGITLWSFGEIYVNGLTDMLSALVLCEAVIYFGDCALRAIEESN
jgi:hypothetical protein